MKHRIVETVGGNFYPQFKQGFFSFWKFFSKEAESHIDSDMMFMWMIGTDDPDDAICFPHREGAQAYILRVHGKAHEYWIKQTEKKIRSYQGVEAKKIHKIR